MCGIAGLASATGAADPERLRAMSATLVHRGPDADGQLLDGPVAIASRRLSIIDLQTGDQPIANEDGTVHVVHNGELYNYRELRARLEHAGHRFATHSDTEVLVHLYEEHGDAFAERLRGMFAFAIWDSRRRRLLLARDRLGIKPLYYAERAGTFVFGSEIKALLAHPAATTKSASANASSSTTCRASSGSRTSRWRTRSACRCTTWPRRRARAAP